MAIKAGGSGGKNLPPVANPQTTFATAATGSDLGKPFASGKSGKSEESLSAGGQAKGQKRSSTAREKRIGTGFATPATSATGATVGEGQNRRSGRIPAGVAERWQFCCHRPGDARALRLNDVATRIGTLNQGGRRGARTH